MKLYINEDTYLQEGIDDIKKYYPNIPDDIFIQLIELDPTYREGSSSAGKYGKWLLNLYNKGNLSETEFEYIPQLLNQFTTYRNRIQNKDLNSYKSLSALEDVLASVVDNDSMLTDRQKVRFLKNVKSGKIKTSAEDDYDVVLETPKFIVYVPNTHEASMFLGKGTEWCTAHENPEHYNQYTKDGCKLYIVKNKATGERWQYSDDTQEFLDEHDEEFNTMSLLHQDKKLSKFFENLLEFDFFNFDGTLVYDGEYIPRYLRHSVLKVIVDEDVDYIDEDAFWKCSLLSSITIPNTVTEIYGGAFAWCYSLSSVILPKNITFIDNNTFYKCTSLTSVTIPNSVTEIGYNAFEGCSSLSSLVIPNSVKVINDNAFINCNKLTIYTNNKYVEEYCNNNNIPVKPVNKNESVRKERRVMKLCIKEDAFAKARMCGYAVSYRDMTKGYYYLLCFESENDANNCEDAFYRIEDMSTDEEDFWDTFNHYRLLADVWYDEIDWRRDIHRDVINGMERKVYTDRNGNSWIIINGIPFDFYF